MVKMFGGMFVLGRVATGRVSANQAHAEVDPGVPNFNAVFTNMFVGVPYFDLIEVSAFFGPRFLRLRARHFGVTLWRDTTVKDYRATLE
jgi:hypothetical protein